MEESRVDTEGFGWMQDLVTKSVVRLFCEWRGCTSVEYLPTNITRDELGGERSKRGVATDTIGEGLGFEDFVSRRFFEPEMLSL